jgi:hypothetical protein
MASMFDELLREHAKKHINLRETTGEQQECSTIVICKIALFLHQVA